MRLTFALLLSATCVLPGGCFTDPTPVDSEDGDGGTSEGEASSSGAEPKPRPVSTAGTTGSSTGGESTAGGESSGESSSDSVSGGSTGAAGACGCGLDPELGLWCGPDLVEAPEASVCPAEVADLNGQPCDVLDPPLTEIGCCVDGGTIALCYQGQILVEGCGPDTFDTCP